MDAVEPDASTETVTVTLDRFVAGGEVLGHDDEGRVVFVAGATEGETARVRPRERHDRWMRADLVAVEVAGPDRVDPPCPRRVEGCGGCDWQHVEVAAQRAAKLEVVRDAMRRTGRLSVDVLADVLRSGGSVPSVGYRTTVRVVGGADRRAAFRRERSDRTVHAAGCLVAHPELVDLIGAVRVDPGVEVSLRVSADTGERSAMWDADLGAVEVPADVRTGPDARIHERVAGHRLRVSAASFFQSGPAAAALLVRTVTELAPELDGAEHVVDAYGGIGLFAVAAAPGATTVTVVETSATACDDARANLAGRDARVVRSQVDRWASTDRSGSPEVVIADPARHGLGKPGVAALERIGAPVVILVSCDPVAGARDVAALGARGYHAESIRVLDLFPHTHHVETVTRFTRSAIGSR